MTYKRTYSQQEIDELVAWIDTHPAGRVDLGGGVVIDDLATCTQAARHTLLTQGTKPTFSGYVHTLMQAKEILHS